MPRPPVNQPPPTQLLRVRHFLDRDGGLVTDARSSDRSFVASSSCGRCPLVVAAAAVAVQASVDDGSLRGRHQRAGSSQLGAVPWRQRQRLLRQRDRHATNAIYPGQCALRFLLRPASPREGCEILRQVCLSRLHVIDEIPAKFSKTGSARCELHTVRKVAVGFLGRGGRRVM